MESTIKKWAFLSILIFLGMNKDLSGQVVFVDAHKGKDDGNGTITDPFATLAKGVEFANRLSSEKKITIKVFPGLYVLKEKLAIGNPKFSRDCPGYNIEAAIMPDDSGWSPNQMPVILSVSPDNSEIQFTHSVGILVATNNVSFKGIKFLGNSNPDVQYYYPITREDQSHENLEVSQCYFIGERNSAPIQGAIWAHGAGTRVDHCIFYNCKNALLLFKSIRNFSITHSIIYGAYEAAVWFGPFESKFNFMNNIISNCNYFWLRPENTFPQYIFSNSVISGNKYYMGMYTNNGLIESEKNDQTEIGIRKSGIIQLREVETDGLPADYLNLLPQSYGSDLDAGIFKKPKR